MYLFLATADIYHLLPNKNFQIASEFCWGWGVLDFKLDGYAPWRRCDFLRPYTMQFSHKISTILPNSVLIRWNFPKKHPIFFNFNYPPIDIPQWWKCTSKPWHIPIYQHNVKSLPLGTSECFAISRVDSSSWSWMCIWFPVHHPSSQKIFLGYHSVVQQFFPPGSKTNLICVSKEPLLYILRA